MMNYKKRKLSEYQGYENVYENTRSKKLKENNFNGYVSGSQVINWFINDCLVDWIKLRDVLGKEKMVNKDSEEKFLTSQGNLFEQEIVKYIDDNIYPSVFIGDSRGWNETLVNKTLEEMKKGTPVIYSAALQNKKLKVYGTADLLVRNDYLSKIFTDLQVEENEKVKTIFNHPFYYVVIDVKWCTLNLKKDGIEISDTNRFPGYKGQLLIYSRCLEEMQGYFPQRAYLLGRKCTWSEGETKNPLIRPGIFYTSNQDIQTKTNKAIEWIRDLNYEGMNWTLYPPSRPELYPNLGNRSFLPFKKELAEKIGDLSMLCNLKSERKKKAFEQGIYNINDSRLNSKVLGMDGKDGKILDKILNVNRGENFMLPLKLEGNQDAWRDEADECFVDFETLNDIGINNKDVMQQKSNDMVFLIGVGYKDYKDSKGEWTYKSFVANEMSFEGERRVLERFLDFMSKQGFRKAWYYL